MKRMVAGLVLLALVMVPVLSMAQDAAPARPAPDPAPVAQEPAPGRQAAAPVVLDDLTLTGKISKEETLVKGRDGVTETKVDVYFLTDEKGEKIALPADAKAPSVGRGETPPAPAPEAGFKLEGFVDADVKIMAKGQVIDRGGKKTTVAKIITIEKIQK